MNVGTTVAFLASAALSFGIVDSGNLPGDGPGSVSAETVGASENAAAPARNWFCGETVVLSNVPSIGCGRAVGCNPQTNTCSPRTWRSTTHSLTMCRCDDQWDVTGMNGVYPMEYDVGVLGGFCTGYITTELVDGRWIHGRGCTTFARECLLRGLHCLPDPVPDSTLDRYECECQQPIGGGWKPPSTGG